MTKLIIGLGVVLILVILYLLFKVSNLVGLARSRDVKVEARVDSSNKVNAALFLIFTIVSLLVFFWYSFAFFEDYNPYSFPGIHDPLFKPSAIQLYFKSLFFQFA